jgi:hypothetical protein
MDALKGQGKAVSLITRGADLLCLVVYADDSCGILRNGKLICVWEPHEAADGIRTFTAMSGTTLDALELARRRATESGLYAGASSA